MQFKDECEPGFIIVVTSRSLIRKLRSVPFMSVLERFDWIRFLTAPVFALFCLFVFFQLIALEPPYRPPCGTRKLITSNIYSSSRCLMECSSKQLMEICNCSRPTLPLGGNSYIGYFMVSEP